jgi:hypothetical protein
MLPDAISRSRPLMHVHRRSILRPCGLLPAVKPTTTSESSNANCSALTNGLILVAHTQPQEVIDWSPTRRPRGDDQDGAPRRSGLNRRFRGFAALTRLILTKDASIFTGDSFFRQLNTNIVVGHLARTCRPAMRKLPRFRLSWANSPLSLNDLPTGHDLGTYLQGSTWSILPQALDPILCA